MQNEESVYPWFRPRGWPPQGAHYKFWLAEFDSEFTDEVNICQFVDTGAGVQVLCPKKARNIGNEMIEDKIEVVLPSVSLLSMFYWTSTTMAIRAINIPFGTNNVSTAFVRTTTAVYIIYK